MLHMRMCPLFMCVWGGRQGANSSSSRVLDLLYHHATRKYHFGSLQHVELGHN